MIFTSVSQFLVYFLCLGVSLAWYLKCEALLGALVLSAFSVIVKYSRKFIFSSKLLNSIRPPLQYRGQFGQLLC